MWARWIRIVARRLAWLLDNATGRRSVRPPPDPAPAAPRAPPAAPRRADRRTRSPCCPRAPPPGIPPPRSSPIPLPRVPQPPSSNSPSPARCRWSCARRGGEHGGGFPETSAGIPRRAPLYPSLAVAAAALLLPPPSARDRHLAIRACASPFLIFRQAHALNFIHGVATRQQGICP